MPSVPIKMSTGFGSIGGGDPFAEIDDKPTPAASQDMGFGGIGSGAAKPSNSFGQGIPSQKISSKPTSSDPFSDFGASSSSASSKKPSSDFGFGFGGSSSTGTPAKTTSSSSMGFGGSSPSDPFGAPASQPSGSFGIAPPPKKSSTSFGGSSDPFADMGAGSPGVGGTPSTGFGAGGGAPMGSGFGSAPATGKCISSIVDFGYRFLHIFGDFIFIMKHHSRKFVGMIIF